MTFNWQNFKLNHFDPDEGLGVYTWLRLVPMSLANIAPKLAEDEGFGPLAQDASGKCRFIEIPY